MSYLVFARKWRPKNFDEVVGQEHVTRTLKSAIAANKLAHAYLFAGSQGVGKTSCARILAKSLNCVKGPTVNPCGVCSACQEIAEGRSLDCIEIDGASNRGIDEIRTLRENVKFAPLNGRYKVYIIDEVHMLTSEAFNALLKTLEEPPPTVKFIFATTHPQKVLPTILSRCQRFDFTRIPNLKIVDKLKEIAQDEKMTIGDDVFFAIAKASEGSLRDAESILDQLISFTQKDIKLADVVSVLGVIEEEAFIDFVNAMVAQDASLALNLIAEAVSRGKDMSYFQEGLLEHYRNLMVLKVMKAAGEALVDLSVDTLKRLTDQASLLTLSDIMVSINHILAAQDMARKLNGARIPLEILAVKLSMLGLKKEEKVLPPRHNAPLEILKEEKGTADNALTSLGTVPACSLSVCRLEDVVSKWGELIAQLSQIKMSVATYLKEARPTRLENDTLTVGFPKNAVFFKEAMAHKDNLKIFERTLATVVGGALKVNLDIVEGLDIMRETESAVDETPLLKSTLDLFKGRVIKKV
jgi:DNA polymerase-3 subunit gamma/tau